MLNFTAFGGVSVSHSTGIQPAGAASQRRVLGFLAFIACSGKKGVSREQIVGLFWPDADDDRARHALSQILYHTRTSLREPTLFVAGADVRLNPEVFSTDIWEFERLLAEGRDEQAVELYRGPFLDGFTLPGSAEFEDWSSSQRRRYESLVSAALERLATRAESASSWSEAVVWRKRLASIDVASSRAALKLMQALVQSGDSVAALWHADLHRRAVRALLEAEPDASITELESSIRAAAAAAPAKPAAKAAPSATTPAPAATPGPATGHAPEPPQAPDTAAPAIAASTVTSPLPPSVTRSRRRKLAFAGLAAAAVAVITAAAMFLLEPPAQPLLATSDSKPTVVAPFRVTGADESLAYLNAGMIDLLGSRLQFETVARTVDASRTVSAWEDLGLTADDVDRANGLRLAHAVGAADVIVGSIVGNSQRIYLSASVLDVRTAARIGEATAEGPTDSLAKLIDRLAAQVLAIKYRESDRFTNAANRPLNAMQFYVAGQQAYRGGQYQAAVRQYEAALRADSQFALAAFQLALAADRLNDAEQNHAALAVAWNNRDELVPRDRAQLFALAGRNYPLPSSVSDAVSELTRPVTLRPLRPETWYELGERLLRQGRALGVEDANRRAVSAFTRALELDPEDRAGARGMLIIAAAQIKDTATIFRYASTDGDSVRKLSPFVRWTIARVRGDSAALERMRRRFDDLDPESLRLISMSSLYDGGLTSDGERAAALLARNTVATRGVDALLAQHAFALASGDSARALAATERIRDRLPGTHAYLRLRVLDAIYGGRNKSAAERAVTEIERGVRYGHARTETARAVYYADLCVLEQWRLRHGNFANTSSTIDALESSGFPRVPVAISTNPHTCATILRAWLAVETGRPDAHSQVMTLDSLLFDGPAVGDAARYAPILLARLHLRFNDRDRALAALRRRAYLAGWPRYVGTVREVEKSLLGATRARSVTGHP